MAMTLEEFVKNAPQIKAEMRRAMYGRPYICKGCTLKTHMDRLESEGVYHIGKRQVCSDKYYGEFGKEIDAHPICMPRRPHGC